MRIAIRSALAALNLLVSVPATAQSPPPSPPKCLNGAMPDGKGGCIPPQQICLAGTVSNGAGGCTMPQKTCPGGSVPDASGGCRVLCKPNEVTDPSTGVCKKR